MTTMIEAGTLVRIGSKSYRTTRPLTAHQIEGERIGVVTLEGGSKPFRALIPSLLPDCQRCGGAGGWKGWPGFTCYRCGGTGKETKEVKAKAAR